MTQNQDAPFDRNQVAALPHVLFLLRLNNLGGAELSMISIAAGLRDQGFPVTLAIYGTHTSLAGEIAAGIPIIDMNASRTLTAAPCLLRLLKKTRPDFLITSLAYTNILGILSAYFAGGKTKVIITDHSPLLAVIKNRKDFKNKILRYLVGAIYPAATAIVAVSKGIATQLAGLLWRPQKINIIYNPIIADTEMTPPTIADPWLDSSDKPILIAVGRLSSEKGFDTLLRAFALLKTRFAARLVILGEGNERGALESLARDLGIADDIYMPGFAGNVAGWLKRSSVFVCASRFEGFGNAIVEALGCGLPIVSTDCPVGPSEILEGGKFGWLVPVDDPAAMAAALETALRKRDASIGESYLEGIKRASLFTKGRCVNSYANLIVNLHAPVPP